ncbi:MAG: aspartate kinase, partial [Cellulophaga sp.]
MKIFKFGGASVKDATGVKNVVNVLQQVGHTNTLVVVSAMGKTTNAMEDVVNAYFNDKAALPATIQEIVDFHTNILNDLFDNTQHEVYAKVKVLFDEVQGFLAWNKSPKRSFVYDQVVGYGELLSTTILNAYLNQVNIQSNWLDVREFIK